MDLAEGVCESASVRADSARVGGGGRVRVESAEGGRARLGGQERITARVGGGGWARAAPRSS